MIATTVGRVRRAPDGSYRVAFDATPLLGRPTGIGVFTAEVLRGLAARDEFRLLAYAVTWLGRGRVHDLVQIGRAHV